MKFDLWLGLGGGLTMVVTFYALSQLRSSGNQNGRKENLPGEERTLAEVSRLWTGRETELDFRDIARIWRTTPEVRTEPKPTPNYRHPEIREFHARWLEHPVLTGIKREIIEQLLLLLDKEGDCPSVVQKNSLETEKKYDPSVFTRLAKIPLWRHSLDVATRLVESTNQALLIPDALIAGLGHDLGKIPAYQNTLYRTGDHPILSLIVLNKLPGFEKMATRDEVSLAIRQHHLLQPESALGRALKDADHQVRLMEISRLTPELAKAETAPKSAPASSGDPAPDPERLSPLPNKEVESESPDRNDLDTLVAELNLDRLLDGLKGKINRLSRNRWSIISVSEGWVLAQPDALWNEVKRAAGNPPAFLAADADEERKRRMLNLIVQRLAEEKRAIATHLLGEGYHTTQCLVVTEGGKSMKLPLIPFLPEAFGCVPSTLEALKPDALRRMVKMVKVFQGSRKAGPT